MEVTDSCLADEVVSLVDALFNFETEEEDDKDGDDELVVLGDEEEVEEEEDDELALVDEEEDEEEELGVLLVGEGLVVVVVGVDGPEICFGVGVGDGSFVLVLVDDVVIQS